MFADDPEVILLSVDEKKTKLALQVGFKGGDKPCIKFDFNVEQDTAEDVVREMVPTPCLALLWPSDVDSGANPGVALPRPCQRGDSSYPEGFEQAVLGRQDAPRQPVDKRQRAGHQADSRWIHVAK